LKEEGALFEIMSNIGKNWN